MKSIFQIALITSFISLTCDASSVRNNIQLSSTANHQNHTNPLQEEKREEGNSLDLSNISQYPCQRCGKPSEGFCAICRAVFYCSERCQINDCKRHSKNGKCTQNHKKILLQEGEKYNKFLNSYGCIDLFQYESEEQQKKCVASYLRKNEYHYFLNIPKSIKQLIFKIYYTASRESDEMLQDFNRIISSHSPDNLLKTPMKSNNPMYLVQCFQCIEQQKYDGTTEKKIKKFFLQKIAIRYSQLAYYASFQLQAIFSIALVKVIKESDHALLDEVNYDSFTDSLAYTILPVVLRKGKAAVTYSSKEGFAQLKKEVLKIKQEAINRASGDNFDNNSTSYYELLKKVWALVEEVFK